MRQHKEIDLQKMIVDWLNLQGHYCWRTNVGLAFYRDNKGRQRAFRSGFKGMSDICGITRDGRFIAIECKVGYNKPTSEQQDFLDKVTQRGGVAMWVNNFDQAVILLKEL